MNQPPTAKRPPVLRRLVRFMAELGLLGLIMGAAWALFLRRQQVEIKALKEASPVQVHRHREGGITYLLFVTRSQVQVRNYTQDSADAKRGY